ncbi:MAG TPA: hypothetical protein ENH45_06160 [Nitrospirae bacterium]|nr:hypothetical protein BMS3Abin09_00466 [bacterium BMS3Abin09]GBE41067.1 hypothetical protein BMS3Bbin09_00956 [bacterium BMS3Bbin09]HDH34093.1 hypothetical protein [Nitrospirota bacterium]HDN95424.1 hypothetical protein [Nitrospirota bacterium]HDZ84788.1 hypothetical protein [Nitrospirota bacterium]
MKNKEPYILILILVFILAACSTAYKATPLPFKDPSSFENSQEALGAVIAAKAYSNAKEASEAFGFNIREAGMLPVQIVFDNKNSNTIEIDPSQTFLEDKENNLWPILEKNFAYERATKYAQTKEIFKEGSYNAFLGATAGALIGAAVGIVTGDDIVKSAGKGAAVGAAGGGVIGGADAFSSNDATKSITNDLKQKSLQTRSIGPNSLAHGFIFFPGEAKSAKQLRLKIIDVDTGSSYVLFFNF